MGQKPTKMVLHEHVKEKHCCLTRWHSDFLRKTYDLASYFEEMSSAAGSAMLRPAVVLWIFYKLTQLLNESIQFYLVQQDLQIFSLHPSSVKQCWKLKSFDGHFSETELR